MDRKTVTDVALSRLLREMRAGTIPYSVSAILSAMEDCDDAMHDIWQRIQPTVLAQIPEKVRHLNVSRDDMRTTISQECITTIHHRAKA